ncbi:putative candidate secreted effector protein [Blumeria hordei DH14]|uniref:Putative candidate secreted effector protein n=1 Tax=Blumeria graminis f. sp. hordei (strain DH14) TaxID=546991 RepID=N1JJG7_BLUG1|nr:putative candidate secreted effector protein [Blumeria hordei DH14]
MNLLYFTEIATILSLFTLLCTATGLDEGYEMYNCYGQTFYSNNVYNTALKSFKMSIGESEGYPRNYEAPGLDGTPPYTIFPILNEVLFKIASPKPYYFLVVDGEGAQAGMVYETSHGYVAC